MRLTQRGHGTAQRRRRGGYGYKAVARRVCWTTKRGRFAATSAPGPAVPDTAGQEAGLPEQIRVEGKALPKMPVANTPLPSKLHPERQAQQAIQAADRPEATQALPHCPRAGGPRLEGRPALSALLALARFAGFQRHRVSHNRRSLCYPASAAQSACDRVQAAPFAAYHASGRYYSDFRA
jgi:hypothetical protein